MRTHRCQALGIRVGVEIEEPRSGRVRRSRRPLLRGHTRVAVVFCGAVPGEVLPRELRAPPRRRGRRPWPGDEAPQRIARSAEDGEELLDLVVRRRPTPVMEPLRGRRSRSRRRTAVVVAAYSPLPIRRFHLTDERRRRNGEGQKRRATELVSILESV
ncbi:unnamed protein product [Musa acuminata subsp. burmannicoides]